MKTIRGKLFLLFTGFMLAVVLGGILLNALFLENYYIYKSQSMFRETSKRIEQTLLKDRHEAELLMDAIDRAEGINCTVVDRSGFIVMNSFPQKPGSEGRRLPIEIEDFIRVHLHELSKKAVSDVLEKPADQAPKLVYVSNLSSGDRLVLKKSMKGIDESVAIANQFYVISGILIMLIGGGFIFGFSKRLTHPIVEMSSVAEAMSNLDFEHRVALDTQDELGNLGRSINKLSLKLSNSLASLRKDVDRRKQLVRNLSHELKTPISVIKGYSEGLKFGIVEGAEATKKYCTVISEECDRMESMVHELLHLSMLESGSFNIKQSTFELSDFLESIVERMRSRSELKGNPIHFELKLEKGLLLTADPELMDRAITNYLTNAQNHAEGDQPITVSAEKTHQGIQITVFNVGRPIPEDELDSIWDVFYKVDKARTRDYGGHGVGLSIVRLIAELHGGTTGVRNQGEGVLFFIEIP